MSRVFCDASMSRRAAGAVLVRELGLIGLLVLGACSIRGRPTESRGPFLSIVQREATAQRDAARGRAALAPAAMALALGGLPSEALPRLREYLAVSADEALRRAAPELLDLDDVAPSDPLCRALLNLPALTAAANVLGSPWEAPGISVHLGPVCESAAARCVPLFAPPVEAGDALSRRGRALAWSLGNAALLRVPASGRAALLHALREAQPQPSGTFAMVFDATRGKLDEVELDLLRGQAHRALADIAADSPRRPWLTAIEATQADWQLPIVLADDQLLVIPRLSALARLRDFAAEVERAGAFDWVVRPVPTAPARVCTDAE
jgi:hypothetical protein